MNYERAQNDFMGLYAPNLIYHSIFTTPIKLEPTFIHNSSDESFQDDSATTLVSTPCPSTYSSMVCTLFITKVSALFHFRIYLM